MAEIKETLEQTPTSPEVASIQSREIIDLLPKSLDTVPRELKSFLQKIEESPIPVAVTNDSGQPQLTPTPTNPKVVLPVTRKSFVAGFKKKLDDASHWLSAFLFREIKLKEGNVSFKPSDDS